MGLAIVRKYFPEFKNDNYKNGENDLIIRQLNNLAPYKPIWEAMQSFTARCHPETTDEIWLLEHEPVFTQGLAGKTEHVLNTRNIPLIRTDRGGQVTYHGPGQLIVYLLLNISRLRLSGSTFVRMIENTVSEFLRKLGIPAQGKESAPGVYVNDRKICSIGLRVRKGFSYHGLALNVGMDLTPFNFINPCGFKGLMMTQLQDYVKTIEMDTVKKTIISFFLKNFGYNRPAITEKTSWECLINECVRSH